jgi:hypothetical protein
MLAMAWQSGSAWTYDESLCRHGVSIPVGLRAVGNPILMKFADTMLGTEAIHAQNFPSKQQRRYAKSQGD